MKHETVNVITLSNVLEHIENRTELLTDLNNIYKPEKFIIRVPMFDRDWRVPLKKEIGIDYRLDNTHYIEYTQKDFISEIDKANLVINHIQINWGEIWAIITPK